MISGFLEIYLKNELFRVLYLRYKDVLKICSFFNYNYGTIIVDDENENELNRKSIESVNCPLNATNLHMCKLKKNM